MNTAIEKTQPVHPMVAFKRDLDAVVSRELAMLDERAKQRMQSAAVVAVTKDPDLLAADRGSFMAAIRMCAQHGVVPDGNEAVLQTYNTKAKAPDGREIWIKMVTYLPMIRGIINRVMRSGKVKVFRADVVHEGETFTLDQTRGDTRPVHDFDPMRRNGDIVGAYSVAVYQDGTVDTEVMPMDEIQKVRAVAKTKNVWDGWLAEKAKVAVMKRHSKRLPLSAEDMDFILNREETDFDQPLPAKEITPMQRKIAQARGKPMPPGDAVGEVLTGEVLDQEPPHWTELVDTADAFPGSDEFTAGVEAFKAGLPVTDCPYDADRAKAVDWLGGWEGARDAKGGEA